MFAESTYVTDRHAEWELVTPLRHPAIIVYFRRQLGFVMITENSR